MTPNPTPTSVPNPLAGRDPELARRLATFRQQVSDLLYDQLGAHALKQPAFASPQCPHAYEEVRAVALILNVLTKPSWDDNDLYLVDTFWRTAARSDLFADEFEAERVRIQQDLDAGRKALRPNGPPARSLF
jgi:hypothetical protein